MTTNDQHTPRQMTPMRRLAYRVLAPLAEGIIRLVWSLCRAPRIIGTEHLTESLAHHPALIPVFWHQHQLYCGRLLLDARAQGLEPAFLVSPSVDGEIGAILIERFGAHAIRGSSTRTGARALRDIYAVLMQRNWSPVMTADGPRGPRFEFKAGAILLAQMSGRPMLPMAYAASRAILFHWDRFVIPLPLARIVVAVGPPQYVPRTQGTAELARLQEAMKQQLHALYGQARDALGRQS